MTVGSGTARQRARRDRRDRRSMLGATAVVMTTACLWGSLRAEYVYGPLIPTWADVSVWSRLAAVSLSTVMALLALAVLRPERGRPSAYTVVAILCGGVAAGLTQAVAQHLFGMSAVFEARFRLHEAVSIGAVAVVAGTIGYLYAGGRRTLLAQEELSAESRLQVGMALGALQYEEVRVRREVAEGLHGSLQQRLVLLVARIDAILQHVEEGSVTEADVRALRQVRAGLEETREVDVRGTSRMLYPEGLEVGMVPAVRALLSRLPATIATTLSVQPEVRLLDDPVQPTLTQTERLLAVRVVEEAVNNALRHGSAPTITVQLGCTDAELSVVVRDTGTGFDMASEPPRSGTLRLASRLALVGGTVTLTSEPGRGTTLEAHIPLGAGPSGVSRDA